MKTITVEASLSHASHLKNRMTNLISLKKVDQNRFDLLELCIGFVTKNTNVEGIHSASISYKEFLEITSSMKHHQLKSSEQSQKPRNIQGELANEIVSVPSTNHNCEYITIGLHACGDLSILIHEIALNSNQCGGSISISCC
jgi:hypothetical protein